jgi:hypothetical protein
MVVVVLPTPPFWLHIDTTRAWPWVARGFGSGITGIRRPVGPSSPVVSGTASGGSAPGAVPRGSNGMGSIIGTLFVDGEVVDGEGVVGEVVVGGKVMASLGSLGSGPEGSVDDWGTGGAWVSGGISGAVDPRPNRPNRCPPSLIAGVLRR